MFSVNPFAGFFLLTSFSSVVTRDSNRIVLWSADCLAADGCGGCASEVIGRQFRSIKRQLTCP